MLAFILLLTPTAIANEQPRVNPPLHIIVKHAERKYRLPAGILSAVIKVESNGQPNIINHDDGTKSQRRHKLHVKSYGLMQIQMAAATQMGFRGKPEELRKQHVNIEYGARYLKWALKTHHNNLAQALVCYNGGPSSRPCILNEPTPYLAKILNAWRLTK